MTKTVVLVTALAAMVFALLGGLAGQARAQERPQVIPHVTCGDFHTYTSSGTTYQYYGAWLGYTSTYEENKTLPAGTQYNYFFPGSLNRGQPSDFSPGRHDYSFFIVNHEHISSKLFWVIDDGYITINSELSRQWGIPSCQGEGPAAPAATTSPASGLGPTGATLNALVDPNGEDATYRFEYAEEAEYNADAPDPYALGGKSAEGTITGGDARTVHHELTGLLPGTTYHYRVVATNGLGATAAGADQTFTTPEQQAPPNTAPTIQAISPTPGSEIHHRTPTVRAKVKDVGTDLRRDNIRLWVDGTRVEGYSYDRAKDQLSYETPKLGHGRHTVLVVARDEQGLSSSRFWAFRVAKR